MYLNFTNIRTRDRGRYYVLTFYYECATLLIHFHNRAENDSCLEVAEIRARLTDEEVRKIIAKKASCETATQFQALAIKDRDEVLRKLKKSGASVRQVSRLTGISKGVVERIFRT